MVAVVGNLIEIQAGARIHTHHPLKPPPGLIENIGHTVGSRTTGGIILIGPHVRVLPVGKQELIHGICRSRQVLEIIGSIVPAAAHVEMLAVEAVVQHHKAVMLVALSIVDGIIAASLLAQIIQRKLVEPVAAIRVAAYIQARHIKHRAGSLILYRKAVITGSRHRRKIYTGRSLCRRPGSADNHAVEVHSARFSRLQLERQTVDRLSPHIYGSFEIIREITYLINS